MQFRHGFIAAAIAVLAFLPTLAAAHDRDHRGYSHGGSRVGVTLNFGAPAYYGPRYGYGGYYRPHYWNDGYWYSGWHGGRYGRWWVVGPSFYFYDAIPVVREYNVTRVVEAPPTPAGPPPAQNWYLCEDTGYYYPHVTECASGWTIVPATPPR